MSKKDPDSPLEILIHHLLVTPNIVKKGRGGSTSQVIDYLATQTQYGSDMVQKWRSRRAGMLLETVRKLAYIGNEVVHLPMAWGVSLYLFAYPSEKGKAIQFAESIWTNNVLREIPNNLPHRQHVTLVGRKNQLEKLAFLLSPKVGINRIEIAGVGGVGKTALVLECAYQCLEASQKRLFSAEVPTFDAILFVTAKLSTLHYRRIQPVVTFQKTVNEICKEIAKKIHVEAYASSEEMVDNVLSALGRQRTLLIVDNLETMEDKASVMDFLDRMPVGVKIVYTTRDADASSQIRMPPLSHEASRELILNEIGTICDLSIDEDALNIIVTMSGGIPAAMKYAVGDWSLWKDKHHLRKILADPSGDIAQYCFNGMLTQLRDQIDPGYMLLLAASLFPKKPLPKAVEVVSGLSPHQAMEGMFNLRRLVLVYDIEENERPTRLQILPLTREYALFELDANKEIEQQLRKRWIDYYVDLAKRYGGYDWDNCQIQMDPIADEWENIKGVLEWCVTQGMYSKVCEFWQNEHFGRVSFIYGYWEDRIYWNTWIKNEAEARGDWKSALTASAEIIKPSVWMGWKDLLEKARSYFEAGEQQLKYLDSVGQVTFIDNGVLLYGRLKMPERQNELICHELELLELPGIDADSKKRLRLSPLYYHPGAICFRTGDMDTARRYFLMLEQEALTINWQRMVTHARNWLADIAINQKHPEQAKEYLYEGFITALRNRDRRKIACFHRSYAAYNLLISNYAEAEDRAKKALELFQKLGMQPEIQQMHNFIQRLTGCCDEFEESVTSLGFI